MKFLNITLLFALFFLVSCNNKTQNTQETTPQTEMTAAERNEMLAAEKAQNRALAAERAAQEAADSRPKLNVGENGKMKENKDMPTSSRLRGQFAENTRKAEAKQISQPQAPQPQTNRTTTPPKTTSNVIDKMTAPKSEPATEQAAKVVEEVAEPAKPAVPTHEIWDALLSKNVSSTGKVNYGNLKANESKLDEYLAILSKNAPQSDWSRDEAKAFWLNAYNAFTVKLILKNYPLSSITDLHDGKPWDVKWIEIGDKTYSLNNIENDIVRPTYKDGRIHFAVNCAAKSCPPLYNKAFTAKGLSGTLTALAKKFINNSQYNTIGADAVKVSKIFEWYAVDFDDLVTYLNKYSTTKIKADADVSYQDYDWSLNK